MSAAETENLIQSTMQINHAGRAGLLVKPGDVLRDHARDDPAVFQSGEINVSGVWYCSVYPWPTQGRAAPVALPFCSALDKFSVLYGLAAQPVPMMISVGWDAGRLADTSAGQRHPGTPGCQHRGQ